MCKCGFSLAAPRSPLPEQSSTSAIRAASPGGPAPVSNPAEAFTVRIRCPECSTVQCAVVEPAYPWPIYVHECEKCGYIIMESEWSEVNDA